MQQIVRLVAGGIDSRNPQALLTGAHAGAHVIHERESVQISLLPMQPTTFRGFVHDVWICVRAFRILDLFGGLPQRWAASVWRTLRQGADLVVSYVRAPSARILQHPEMANIQSSVFLCLSTISRILIMGVGVRAATYLLVC